MRALFIGDIFGKPGRKALFGKLQGLIQAHRVDFCIANVENAAAGFGITPQIADELLAAEIDVLTSGNHIWDKRAILPYLAQQPRLLRPHNYPPAAPGTGLFVGNSRCGVRVAVLNLQGRVYMPPIDCPFAVGEATVEEVRRQTPVVLIDFHGEATSEKQAFAWYIDGRVSAVIGTHTHVQTADERILPGGTAFLTDAGMCGPLDSVIGVRKDIVIERFLSQRPNQFETAKNLVYLQGCVIDIDEVTGKARSIERVRERLADT